MDDTYIMAIRINTPERLTSFLVEANANQHVSAREVRRLFQELSPHLRAQALRALFASSADADVVVAEARRSGVPSAMITSAHPVPPTVPAPTPIERTRFPDIRSEPGRTTSVSADPEITDEELRAVLNDLAVRTHPSAEDAARLRLEGHRIQQWPISDYLAVNEVVIDGITVYWNPEDLESVLQSPTPLARMAEVLVEQAAEPHRSRLTGVLTPERCALELRRLATRVMERELGVPLSRAASVSSSPVMSDGGTLIASRRTVQVFSAGPNSTLELTFGRMVAADCPLVLQIAGMRSSVTVEPAVLAEWQAISDPIALHSAVCRVLQTSLDHSRNALMVGRDASRMAGMLLSELQRFAHRTSYHPIPGLSSMLVAAFNADCTVRVREGYQANR